MDLKDKVTKALQESLQPELIQLNDDDGVSGFVVAKRFQRMATYDRQSLIYDLLRSSRAKLSKPELKRIVVIAALTPEEYAGMGVPLEG